MPAWVSDEWEWTEHVESIDVVELDLIYLGDINTLRKQVSKHFYPKHFCKQNCSTEIMPFFNPPFYLSMINT